MKAHAKILVTAALGAGLSIPVDARAERVLVSPSAGFASVVSLSGQDTGKASVAFRQTEEERAAACFAADEIHTRDDEVARDRLKATCAEKAKTASAAAGMRSANCVGLTVRMEREYMNGASFTLLGNEAENGYMRTRWRNNRLGRVVMNCPSCGTPEINDTFRVLCPALYGKRFGTLEPF